MFRRLFVACILASLLAAQGQSSSGGRVRAEMRNIYYHFTDSIAVHIVFLQGDLVPVGKEGLPIFDDPNSFNLEVSSAELTINTSATHSWKANVDFCAGKRYRTAVRRAIVAVISHKRKLHGLSWRTPSLWKTDHDGYGPDDDRSGPPRSFRFLS